MARVYGRAAPPRRAPCLVPVKSFSMASPISGVKSPPPGASREGDRRLRLEDILKLMVVEGLVPAAEADKVARSRTQRFEHPLELIADQRWKSTKPPHNVLSLEWLVEWLAVACVVVASAGVTRSAPAPPAPVRD